MMTLPNMADGLVENATDVAAPWAAMSEILGVANKTNSTEDEEYVVDPTGMGVSLACMDVVLVVGNILTLVVISRFKPKAVPDVLVTALAISDLLTGILPVPIAVYAYLSPWDFSKDVTLCDIFGWLSFATNGGSMFVLTLMAVDRYLAICWPFFYKSKVTVKRTVFLCLGGLAAASVIAIIPVLGSGHMKPYGTHNAYCHFDYGRTTPMSTAYSITILFIGYFFMFIVLFCYVSVICTLRKFITRRKHMSRRLAEISEEVPELTRSPGFHGNHGSPGSQETCLKLEAMFTRMSWVLLMVYWITWTPLLGVITAAQVGQEISPVVDFIAVRLAVLNSVINPFIILCLYEPYRKGYWYIITRIYSPCRKKEKERTPPSNPWYDRRRTTTAGLSGSRSTPTTPTLHHNNLGTPRRCLSMGDVSSRRQQREESQPRDQPLVRSFSSKSILANRSRPSTAIRKSYSVRWNERVTVAGEYPGVVSIDALKEEQHSRYTPRTRLEKYVPDTGSWSDSDSCSSCSGSYYSDESCSDWSEDYCESCDEIFDDLYSNVTRVERPKRTRSTEDFRSYRNEARGGNHGQIVVKTGVRESRPSQQETPDTRERRQSENILNKRPEPTVRDGGLPQYRDDRIGNYPRRGRSKSAENIPVKIETCLYNHSGYRPCFTCRAMYGRMFSGCHHTGGRESIARKVASSKTESESSERSREQQVVVRGLHGDNPQFYNLVFQHVLSTEKQRKHADRAVIRDLRHDEANKTQTSREKSSSRSFAAEPPAQENARTLGKVYRNENEILDDNSGDLTEINEERRRSRNVRHNLKRDLAQRGYNDEYIEELEPGYIERERSHIVNRHAKSKSLPSDSMTGNPPQHLWPSVIIYDKNNKHRLQIQNEDSGPISLVNSENEKSNRDSHETSINALHCLPRENTEDGVVGAPSKAATNLQSRTTVLQEQATQTTPRRDAPARDSSASDVTHDVYPSSGDVSENEIPYNQYVRRISQSDRGSDNSSETDRGIKLEKVSTLGHQLPHIRSSTSSGIGSSTECSDVTAVSHAHKKYPSLPTKSKYSHESNGTFGNVNSGYVAGSDSDAVTTVDVSETPARSAVSPRKLTKKRRSSKTPESKKEDVICNKCGCHVNENKTGKAGAGCHQKSDHAVNADMSDHVDSENGHDAVREWLPERDPDVNENDLAKSLEKSPLVLYRSEVKIKLKSNAKALDNRNRHSNQHLVQNRKDKLNPDIEGILTSGHSDVRQSLFAYENEIEDDEVFTQENEGDGNEFKLLKRYSPKVKNRRRKVRISSGKSNDGAEEMIMNTKTRPVHIFQISTGISQV